jgi:hypothetical protein
VTAPVGTAAPEGGGAGTGAPRGRSRRGAGIVVLVALGALLVSFVVGRPEPTRPPLDPRSHQPDGTSALVSLLRALGAEVDLSIGMPGGGDDVALLLVDRLTDDQRAELSRWVERGGRLVVADPSSPLLPAPATGPLRPRTHDPGRCSIDALTGIGAIEPGRAVLHRVPAGAGSCYGDAAEAFVVATDRGAGTLVALGGPGGLVNDVLADAGNAAVAAALLAPRGGELVRVVDAPPPVGGDETLYDLVAPGVRRALVQLAVAFLVYAAWRAVRLGRPVTEPQLVAVAGSELVSATGRLWAATRDPQAAADRLRADLRAALAPGLGVAFDAPATVLADAAAARHRIDRVTLEAALVPHPVRSDDDLVAVARAVAAVRQEIG